MQGKQGHFYMKKKMLNQHILVIFHIFHIKIHVSNIFIVVVHRTGPSYKKVVYREYNEGFTQPKTHPLSSGTCFRTPIDFVSTLKSI